MKKLIWAVMIAFGLACLPFGGTALASQGQARAGHKTTAHARQAGKKGKSGKTSKHKARKHQAKHPARHYNAA
ncbi:MAG TPA: hypothetical protein VFY06_12420 [Verrucomicrobiae bacterium]|nr:hypothetical protein [Verrucomicrobiae bacterium]